MIKFMKHYVTDGSNKVRVYYSHFTMTTTGQECVTLYAKSYSDNLGVIFENVENDTDYVTDYFDKDKVRFIKGHPLYEDALARCS